MKTNQIASARLFAWLKSNLGKRCLAPLTSVDTAALRAAVQIAEIACYTNSQKVDRAFGEVVMLMQESTRELAFHAIAMVRDWSDREVMWADADLAAIPYRRICNFERGGTFVDGAEPRVMAPAVAKTETSVAA